LCTGRFLVRFGDYDRCHKFAGLLKIAHEEYHSQHQWHGNEGAWSTQDEHPEDEGKANNGGRDGKAFTHDHRCDDISQIVLIKTMSPTTKARTNHPCAMTKGTGGIPAIKAPM